jgi:D-amino-acid dehydrogenase
MSKQVVIIGAGVIGMSAAVECARRGHRVTVIERGSGAEGCSFGNAGMVVPSHFVPLAAPGMVALGLKWMWNPESPFYIKPRLNLELIAWAYRFWRSSKKAHVERAAPLLRDLNMASREAYARLSVSEDFGLVQKGLLMLCKTAHALDEEAAAATKANALGVPAEVLDAKQTAALDPNVTMDIAGSVFFPKDCHLQPERYVAALHRMLRAAGGEVTTDAEVTGWKRDGSTLCAAITTKGEVAGDEFILCGGSWSTGMAAELGLRLPMQAGKGYSLTVQHPVELPQLCAIFTEARIAVTPMSGALRFGGTMEIAGLDETITQRRVQGIVNAVPDHYPKFERAHFDGIKPWRGLRPCSPDGIPYLGRTKAATNLTLATGHAMMGLSLAPVTGELLGQIVDGEHPKFDIEMLAPDRFA